MRVLIQRSVLQRLNGRGGAALGVEWSLRHARRRVHLTLRLDGDEARSGCGPTPAGDLPAAVFALERFGTEGDDLARRRHREDDMLAAGTGAGLELREQRAAVPGPRRSGCGGIDSPPPRAQQKATVDHMLAKGVAILIVDSFTPRNEPKGVCANLDGEKDIQYATRGSNDALAAVAVLKAMPEIDAKHIFLAGFSLGGYSSLLATDSKNPASHNGAVAGVIAYYPFCYDGVDPSVPVLVLIGEKDDWTPAAKCQAVTGKSNFEVVVSRRLPCLQPAV